MWTIEKTRNDRQPRDVLLMASPGDFIELSAALSVN